MRAKQPKICLDLALKAVDRLSTHFRHSLPRRTVIGSGSGGLSHPRRYPCEDGDHSQYDFCHHNSLDFHDSPS
jgi:hypothetical protein